MKKRLSRDEQLTPRDQKRCVCCHICELRIPLELVDKDHPLYGTRDHVIPKSKGGDRGPMNQRPAHRMCNSIKSNYELTDDMRAYCRKIISLYSAGGTAKAHLDEVSGVWIRFHKGVPIMVDRLTGLDIGKMPPFIVA